MKFDNYMILEFPSRSTNEAFARSAVSCFAAQMDPTLEEIGDIRTAVSEAVTNCIVHAYRDTIGKISLDAKCYDDRTVKITVTDHGVGIPDVKKAMEPLYTTCPDEDRCGMGFSIMQSFSDKISVLSKPQKGTKIVLTRKLSASVKTTEKDPT